MHLFDLEISIFSNVIFNGDFSFVCCMLVIVKPSISLSMLIRNLRWFLWMKLYPPLLSIQLFNYKLQLDEPETTLLSVPLNVPEFVPVICDALCTLCRQLEYLFAILVPLISSLKIPSSYGTLFLLSLHNALSIFEKVVGIDIHGFQTVTSDMNALFSGMNSSFDLPLAMDDVLYHIFNNKKLNLDHFTYLESITELLVVI